MSIIDICNGERLNLKSIDGFVDQAIKPRQSTKVFVRKVDACGIEGWSGYMNMENIYIEGGETGINLYFDFQFIDYEDVPIVFIAHDCGGRLYLCDCTEIRFGHQQWTISETTIDIIQSLLNYEISVYDALKSDGYKKYLADYNYHTKESTMYEAKFSDISEYRLPEKNAILEYMDADVDEHFEKLKLSQRMNGL